MNRYRVVLLVVGGFSSAFVAAGCELIAGIQDLSLADGGASGGTSSGSSDDGSATTGRTTDNGTSGVAAGTSSGGGTDGAADGSGATGAEDGGGPGTSSGATTGTTSSSSSSSSGTSGSSGSTSSSSSSSGLQNGDGGGGWIDMSISATACDNKAGTACGWAATDNGLGYTCLCYNGNFAVPWGCEPPNTCVTLGPGCPTSSAPICPADAGQ